MLTKSTARIRLISHFVKIWKGQWKCLSLQMLPLLCCVLKFSNTFSTEQNEEKQTKMIHEQAGQFLHFKVLPKTYDALMEYLYIQMGEVTL